MTDFSVVVISDKAGPVRHAELIHNSSGRCWNIVSSKRIDFGRFWEICFDEPVLLRDKSLYSWASKREKKKRIKAIPFRRVDFVRLY